MAIIVEIPGRDEVIDAGVALPPDGVPCPA